MATASPTIGLHDDHAHDHHEQSFISKYVFSTDHKIIGIQFLITTLFMLLVGGALALAVRWQLAFPWTRMPLIGDLFGLLSGAGTSIFAGQGGQISPEFYTMLFTMHATVMIFLVIIVLVGGASIANYMYANVYERRREIGTLMALGANSSLVLKMFILKALLLGLVGGVGGAAAGTVLAATLGPVGTQTGGAGGEPVATPTMSGASRRRGSASARVS